MKKSKKLRSHPFHSQANLRLKEQYPVTVRASLLTVLGVLIVFFGAFPRPHPRQRTVQEATDIVIEQFDIPPTQQYERPPPPARPAIPVASEDEDLADDVTIDEITFEEFKAWDEPPPPPSEGPRVKFIPYDEPPEPIGGYSAIQKNIEYPEIAREAGVEGTVIVQAFVNKNGRVTETFVLKGLPGTGLDEAAVEAIRKTPFKPAKQRDRPVGVWISIPINFKLKVTT
ncbi:MAG: energy transducer TonB [Fidelibacterota bacterium]